MGVDQSARRGTRKLGSLLGVEEDVSPTAGRRIYS
jgi:hypothetical protein